MQQLPTVFVTPDLTTLDQVQQAEPLTPAEIVATLVAEHGLAIEEMDASTLPEKLRDKFVAFYIEVNGARIVVVPLRQDLSKRAAAIRALLAQWEVMA
ncbi:hypothetical protein ACWEQ7_22175 [Streptomyces sp. NPDC004069]